MSKTYLLDSDTYTFLAEENPNVVAHITALEPEDRGYISFATVGEWEYGYYNTLNLPLRSKIRTTGDRAFDYLSGVIQSSQDINSIYGQIRAGLRRAGTMIPLNDVWIAATALAIGATLVTHDNHFQHVKNLVTADDNSLNAPRRTARGLAPCRTKTPAPTHTKKHLSRS